MFKFPLLMALVFSTTSLFARAENSTSNENLLLQPPQLSLQQAIQASGLSQRLLVDVALEEHNDKLIYRITSQANGEITVTEVDANDGSLIRNLSLNSLTPQLNKAITTVSQGFNGQIISAYTDFNEDVTQPIYIIELIIDNDITVVELDHLFKVVHSERFSEDDDISGETADGYLF